MFDVAPTELIVLGTVALLVIPPKDLPRAMRTAGYWVGRVRGVARQFRSGFDTMLRDAELAEMEKRWKEENERIMREHPPVLGRDVEADHVDAPVTVARPELSEASSPGGVGIAVEHPAVLPEAGEAEPSADGKVSS